MQAFLNPSVRRDPGYRGLFETAEYERVERFYSAHPDLTPTPLRSLPSLAARVGVGDVLIKDESKRWDVEAFKIAGVRYAVEQLDADTLQHGLACATAGNHGRAVARAARDLGVRCTVFLPAARSDAHPSERATRTARVSAMREDSAVVVETTGSYEEAVALAAEHGERTGATVVSDTAWPGYERIPRLIMAGYTRLFDEAALVWPAPPDIVLIQGGVGGLVCAAANWFAFRFGASRPFLIACEPDNAACLLESARAGRLVNLIDDRSAGVSQPPLQTIMAGLRCAEPSPAAWPSIVAGIDTFLSISDDRALDAIETLRSGASSDPAIEAGPSGACSVAAMMALVDDAGAEAIRAMIGLGPSTRVMAIVTEGP
jgi:diaminopropionate ammonia-lyase